MQSPIEPRTRFHPLLLYFPPYLHAVPVFPLFSPFFLPLPSSFLPVSPLLPFLPSPPSRMTLVFFSLSGLDLLGALQEVESMRVDIVEWIYAQQVLPDEVVPGVLG